MEKIKEILKTLLNSFSVTGHELLGKVAIDEIKNKDFDVTTTTEQVVVVNDGGNWVVDYEG